MSRCRTVAVVLVVIASAVLYGMWSFAAPNIRRELSPGQVELVIASDKQVYGIGERPKITASLVNRSGQTILLIPAVDGSARGRYPQVKFDVTPPAGALPEETLVGCGNTNPLTPSDFRLVAPGARLELFGDWGGLPWTAVDRGPGEYKVQLTYATDESEASRWLGGPLSPMQQKLALFKVGPLLGRVPRLRATSNALTLRFDNPFPGPEEMLRKGTIGQASLALRSIAAGHAIADVPGAVVDSIGENDLQRLWPVVSAESDRKRWFLRYSPSALYVLQSALRCPRLDREARLRFLLEYRTTQGPSGSETRGRQIRFDGACAEALFAADGDDIDRVLRDLLENGRLDSAAFALVDAAADRRALSR